MNGLKALIIENEFDVPGEIRGFIKDNPDLFSEISEQLSCQYRPPKDIARFLPDVNAVIVMSTFMDKQQLEEFVDAFSKEPLNNKVYTFFIFHFTRKLNDFNKKHENGSYCFYGFDNTAQVMERLKAFVQQGRVYSIVENHDGSTTEDRYWWGCSSMFADPDKIKIRPLWVPKLIVYNEEHDIFILEDEDALQQKAYL